MKRKSFVPLYVVQHIFKVSLSPLVSRVKLRRILEALV